MRRKASSRDVVEEVFREALSSRFSREFYQVFIFYIDRDLGRDPFEVFLEDPARVYGKIEEIYGFGATFIFRAIYDYIRGKMRLNISFDEFLYIVKSGDKESLKKILASLLEASGCSNPCTLGKWGA
ncbi:MAG: hypothetical protein RMJ00_01155 [Nitrososphaerota archaeon]|nr:hypothetical protein [Candidatus Bathyarchaeota archaeon]MDW8061295.1 hypothetical protein [Nitrososphaerota archaeon]